MQAGALDPGYTGQIGSGGPDGATTQRILCGKCRVDLTGPAEVTNAAVYSCPACGQFDTYENVIKEAQAYFEEVVADHLEKTMTGIAQNSKFMTVTSTPRPKRNFRFILDDVPLE